MNKKEIRIILHGSFGNKESNWFSWLKNELEKESTMI